MLKKGSKLYSILTGTCPKCQNESMYVDQNPYHFTKIMDMHEQCSHCKLRYKIEPNFFFGAMYVSYALAVLTSILIFAVSFFAFEATLQTAFIAILVSLFVLMPIVTRLSRNIYINIFIDYDRKSDQAS